MIESWEARVFATLDALTLLRFSALQPHGLTLAFEPLDV